MSQIFEKYGDALVTYAEEQGIERTELPQSGPPWPETNNVMLEYLCQVTLDELAERKNNITVEDIQELLIWLAVHAWYEGGIAEMSRNAKTQTTQEIN